MSGRYDNFFPQAKRFRRLFIGSLDQQTTDQTIKQHFEQWGEIVECVIMMNKTTQKSRCFGFIMYKTAEMLDDAQNNRPHVIDGVEVTTRRAMPPGKSLEDRSTVRKMFIGGLKDDTTEDELMDVFGRFGKIDQLELIMDKNTGKRKGFCFITFDDFDAVDKCVLWQRISVGENTVEVKKAFSKTRYHGRAGRGGCPDGMNGWDGYINGQIYPWNMVYPGQFGGYGLGSSGRLW